MSTHEIENLFHWIEAHHTRGDGKITLEDLRASLHVDLDGNGIINGDDEIRIVDQNVAVWVANMYVDAWEDKVLTLAEFTAMITTGVETF